MGRYALVDTDGTIDNVIDHDPTLAPAAQALVDELTPQVAEAALAYAALVERHAAAQGAVQQSVYVPPDGLSMIALADDSDAAPGDHLGQDGTVTKPEPPPVVPTIEDRIAALEAEVAKAAPAEPAVAPAD